MAQYVGFIPVVSYAVNNGSLQAFSASGILLQTYSMIPMISNGVTYTGFVSGYNYGAATTGTTVNIANIDVQGALNLGYTVKPFVAPASIPSNINAIPISPPLPGSANQLHWDGATLVNGYPSGGVLSIS